MNPLPNYRPKQLKLGPLEAEILNIIYSLGATTVKDIHERITADPDRELTYSSVATVLHRLTKKGWLECVKQQRQYIWRPLISYSEAQSLEAYEQLQRFLALGKPEIVAAFADSLDEASVAQFEAIAQKIQAVRELREKK
ncbi:MULTISPECIES: BlaI/MecI/CopY family transcriptional regulator [Nostocales]|jgi:transcriptional repressor, CopY family|uniref:Transcriptional repressor, CopY family n=2 Tax=Anabaena variabilis TaxID=264691 RepID=Q3M292_TRIV2|nr:MULTISPECIES: BlaI/MecI/CopY family transcriptional regulator [Nostocales]ABA24894.1 transcriptional repressor, CopY family [Trichormus variabilis ATCC 29413]MBC1218034.1 BlaI/MecI/CopY family transcriptional regulator [Trichormus variabilis ARAD]MBC1256308.1 BlaI/MecI/CopY family transcriptional regulator [Trichormus variabilis V5]MBC1270814.1 BlaI/MecI/CopY family transcriptional regulator [Trichormus variabilis FSR]MBC1305729.1 BlaI/MecI/CopY family transcriptional regulator [Trichormus 